MAQLFRNIQGTTKNPTWLFMLFLLMVVACDDPTKPSKPTFLAPPVSPDYPEENVALSLRCVEGGVVTVERAQIPDLVHDSMIIFTARTEDVSMEADTYRIQGPFFIETGLGVPVCVHSADLTIDAHCNISGEASIPVLKLGNTTMFRWLDDTRFPVDLRTGATLKGDGWLDTDIPLVNDRLYMMFDIGQQGIHANGIGNLVIETPSVVSNIPLPGFLVVFDPLDPSIYWGLRIGLGDKALKAGRAIYFFAKSLMEHSGFIQAFKTGAANAKLGTFGAFLNFLDGYGQGYSLQGLIPFTPWYTWGLEDFDLPESIGSQYWCQATLPLDKIFELLEIPVPFRLKGNIAYNFNPGGRNTDHIESVISYLIDPSSYDPPDDSVTTPNFQVMANGSLLLALPGPLGLIQAIPFLKINEIEGTSATVDFSDEGSKAYFSMVSEPGYEIDLSLIFDVAQILNISTLEPYRGIVSDFAEIFSLHSGQQYPETKLAGYLFVPVEKNDTPDYYNTVEFIESIRYMFHAHGYIYYNPYIILQRMYNYIFQAETDLGFSTEADFKIDNQEGFRLWTHLTGPKGVDPGLILASPDFRMVQTADMYFDMRLGPADWSILYQGDYDLTFGGHALSLAQGKILFNEQGAHLEGQYTDLSGIQFNVQGDLHPNPFHLALSGSFTTGKQNIEYAFPGGHYKVELSLYIQLTIGTSGLKYKYKLKGKYQIFGMSRLVHQEIIDIWVKAKVSSSGIHVSYAFPWPIGKKTFSF